MRPPHGLQIALKEECRSQSISVTLGPTATLEERICRRRRVALIHKFYRTLQAPRQLVGKASPARSRFPLHRLLRQSEAHKNSHYGVFGAEIANEAQE